jgi:hypothetical protein
VQLKEQFTDYNLHKFLLVYRVKLRLKTLWNQYTDCNLEFLLSGAEYERWRLFFIHFYYPAHRCVFGTSTATKSRTSITIKHKSSTHHFEILAHIEHLWVHFCFARKSQQLAHAIWALHDRQTVVLAARHEKKFEGLSLALARQCTVLEDIAVAWLALEVDCWGRGRTTSEWDRWVRFRGGHR